MLYQRIIKTDVPAYLSDLIGLTPERLGELESKGLIMTAGVSVGATYYALLINCTEEPFVTELAYPNKPQRDMSLIEFELTLADLRKRGRKARLQSAVAPYALRMEATREASIFQFWIMGPENFIASKVAIRKKFFGLLDCVMN